MELKPTAVIEDGVFVYNGTFNVPYAAAMDRAVISGNLLEQHQPEQALSEAQAGIAFAPDSFPRTAFKIVGCAAPNFFVISLHVCPSL